MEGRERMDKIKWYECLILLISNPLSIIWEITFLAKAIPRHIWYRYEEGIVGTIGIVALFMILVFALQIGNIITRNR